MRLLGDMRIKLEVRIRSEEAGRKHPRHLHYKWIYMYFHLSIIKSQRSPTRKAKFTFIPL